MKDFKLTSGATLKMSLSEFDKGKTLFKSVAKALGEVKIDRAEHVENLLKDTFCNLIISDEVEKNTWACMPKVIYNDIKVTPELFEDEKIREDYLEVMMIVARENVLPFTKSLSAQFKPLLGLILGQ